MKVFIAGAFGHLGLDVLKSAIDAGHEVIGADINIKDVDFTGFTPMKLDMTNKESIKGCLENVDVVITTVGLTKASQTITAYDIDYQANLNLLEEAIKANVKHFAFVSVIKEYISKDIPMLHAKAMFIEKLKESGITYTIYRPTGYFYDTAHIFQPKVEAGKVTLLKTKTPVKCNVIDTRDFADFIVDHMCDENKEYNVGGHEIYTYEEIAKMFFEAAGKEPVIKYVPAFVFDLIVLMSPKWKRGVVRFGKFTMTEDMVADTMTGKYSFKEYIKEIYEKGLKF